VFYSNADVRSILQGLCPYPHLLFVLTQKVGKKLKAAFQKPTTYARKLKPCKLVRNARPFASCLQFTLPKYAFKSNAKTERLKGYLLFSVTRANVFYSNADVRSILQGLCPYPHLLFVLTQKVGSTIKAAFQKPTTYARKLKPCIVFQASETQGLSRDGFISRFKICLQIAR